MKTIPTTFLALLFFTVSICFWACDDDDTPTFPAAPCTIALPLSALPDSCFDLPRNSFGSIFDPPLTDYRYYVLSASTTEEGVFYYMRGDYEIANAYSDQKIFKHNVCKGETSLVYEIIGGSDITNFSVNGEGEILFQRRASQPILLASATIQTPIEILPAGDYINARWINNDSFNISRWTGGSSFESLIIDQFGNETIVNPVVFQNVAFDAREGKLVIYFRSNSRSVYKGYVGLYDLATEELTLIEDVLTGYQLSVSKVFWLNDDTFIGYTSDVVFKYDLNTLQLDILSSNGNCESKNYYPYAIKLKGREDIILLSRDDYIYNAAGEYRLQHRISVLDIATGEEQILELE